MLDGKRVFDVTAAVAGIVMLSPALVLLVVLCRWLLGSPVFFRQTRVGRDEKPFTVLKFRTMLDARDAAGNLLPDGERLTRFGTLLRTTSLDELPELFNVIKGEMSLVGPRPLYARYLPYYSERERLRHAVRPGLTGWAQIHGRNFLPWNERLALDVWYVENRNFWLDLKIILRTLCLVFQRQGVAPNSYLVEPDLDQERAPAKLEGIGEISESHLRRSNESESPKPHGASEQS